MATYDELYDLHNNSALRNRVRVAVTKKAQTLIDLLAPTNAQLAWAKAALSNPEAEADRVFPYVLAANSMATTAAITGATDAAIQTNVSAAIDKLITIT